ncbi:hypothetical protein PV458_28000 [Streptomyces sp. MN03-5084-2B]|nr:hypothetical protein [Streptomyces sp. MN03-5084-2B]
MTALVRIDTRTTLRSALLVIVLIGPLLLAAAVRVGYPWLTGYLDARYGVDLEPFRPVTLASLVVLHVPLMIGMVGALLVLDDVDDGKVLVLRVSPVTLPRYLAYRVVSAGLVALILLMVTVPLSGLAALTLPLVPALVLAAAQAPLIMLAAAAFAGNKVEGLALLKVLGVVPTAIAPAMRWLPAPATWPLRALPPYWAVDVLWNPTVPGMVLGTALTALAGALLLRRTIGRLSGVRRKRIVPPPTPAASGRWGRGSGR